MNRTIRRGLRTILSLVCVELEAGSVGAFGPETPAGRRGVEDAVAWIETALQSRPTQYVELHLTEAERAALERLASEGAGGTVVDTQALADLGLRGGQARAAVRALDKLRRCQRK